MGNCILHTTELPSWVHYAILDPPDDDGEPNLVEGPSGPFIFRDRKKAEKSRFARGKNVVPVMLLIAEPKEGEDI